jgi:hypothetical protein
MTTDPIPAASRDDGARVADTVAWASVPSALGAAR